MALDETDILDLDKELNQVGAPYGAKGRRKGELDEKEAPTGAGGSFGRHASNSCKYFRGWPGLGAYYAFDYYVLICRW